MTERHLGFDGDSFRAFRDLERPGPIHMLNLLRFLPEADYPDDFKGEKAVTGAEAYAAYGRESAPVFARLGGRIVWRGRMEHMLIGPADEHWDLVFIAEYPDVKAFTSMIKDPQYRAAMIHRQAAVETSRLIRTEPLGVGGNFAD